MPLVAITGRCAATSSARTRSRRPTSPASPCRSSSTPTSSRTRPSCRRSSTRPSTSPRTGRPGPVVIDIPVDVALGEVDLPRRPTRSTCPATSRPCKGHIKQIRAAAKAINEAAAAGALRGRRRDQRPTPPPELLRPRRAAPPAGGDHAHGPGRASPRRTSSRMGMLGMHGTVTANYAVHECDLLIAIGARFDDRVTGKLKAFAPHAKVIHVDVDPAEIGKNVAPHIPIVGDAKHVARRRCVKELEGMEWPPSRTADWLARIADAQGRVPAAATRTRRTAPSRRSSWSRRSTASPTSDAVICTDVGQHQMWATPVLHVHAGRASSSAPAASARWASACRPAIGRQGRPARQDGHRHQRRRRLPDDHAGDGHGGELRACRSMVCILNNGYLGMVRQWQDLFWNKRYCVHLHRGAARLQAKLAEAFGAVGMRVTDEDQVEPALREAIAAAVRRSSTSGCRARRTCSRWCPPAGDHRDDRRRRPQREEEVMKHTLSVLVENKPGVLTRVAGLFARRGFNIESLAVGAERGPARLAHHHRHRRRRAPRRPGHEAAAQAHQRDQDPRPRAGRPWWPPSCCW